jgi:membrane-anchored glycerophosphoryl diester phosphodiesterase (GDPDase)
MNQISVAESIAFGWTTFKKRPLVLMGALVLAMTVSGVSSALLDQGEGASLTLVTVLIGLVSAAIGLMVEIGLVTFALRAHDNIEGTSVNNLWNPKPFIRYLLGQIVVVVVVFLGFVLLVIPGLIALFGLMFSSYLIVDKGRGPIEAVKESWAMTKGHKWQLALLTLSIVGINVLGLLALVVGLLVTIPVSMIAVVHAYRKLSAATPAQAV